jgi:hypothetical protein
MLTSLDLELSLVMTNILNGACRFEAQKSTDTAHQIKAMRDKTWGQGAGGRGGGFAGVREGD